MGIPLPQGMPIRTAGPAPVMRQQGNIYGDLSKAAGDIGQGIDDYQAGEVKEDDRRIMIDNMIRKRQLAQDVQASKERFQQADLDVKLEKEKEDTRQFEVGEARSIRDEEFLTKQKEGTDKSWDNFTISLKEDMATTKEGEERKLPSLDRISELAAMHGVVETAEGRKRLDSLKSQASKSQNPIEREKFDYTKKQGSISREKDLRNEFIKQNKSFQTVGDAYNRIKASSMEPSASGDLALIFNFMKMLDPGSTVREGEFATAAQAGDYGDRIQGMVGRITTGKRLSEDQRADFIDRASKLNSAAKEGYRSSINTYTKLSKQYGVDPERVVVNLGRQVEEDQAEGVQGNSQQEQLGHVKPDEGNFEDPYGYYK